MRALHRCLLSGSASQLCFGPVPLGGVIAMLVTEAEQIRAIPFVMAISIQSVCVAL